MKFTKEMIAKANTAETVEELLEMAKAEGIEISAEAAENYFDFLHGSKKLTSEELALVAGGKGGGQPSPKYRVGQEVINLDLLEQGEITEVCNHIYDSNAGYLYVIHIFGQYDRTMSCYLETDADYVVRN